MNTGHADTTNVRYRPSTASFFPVVFSRLSFSLLLIKIFQPPTLLKSSAHLRDTVQISKTLSFLTLFPVALTSFSNSAAPSRGYTLAS